MLVEWVSATANTNSGPVALFKVILYLPTQLVREDVPSSFFPLMLFEEGSLLPDFQYFPVNVRTPFPLSANTRDPLDGF